MTPTMWTLIWFGLGTLALHLGFSLTMAIING